MLRNILLTMMVMCLLSVPTMSGAGTECEQRTVVAALWDWWGNLWSENIVHNNAFPDSSSVFIVADAAEGLELGSLLRVSAHTSAELGGTPIRI